MGWQQLGCTSILWSSIFLRGEVCQSLSCGLQEHTGRSAGSAGDLEELQLQAGKDLMLKQRQMHCPGLRRGKSISTGWGANSCGAVMQNHRRAGAGRAQTPHVVPTPHHGQVSWVTKQNVTKIHILLPSAEAGWGGVWFSLSMSYCW